MENVEELTRVGVYKHCNDSHLRYPILSRWRRHFYLYPDADFDVNRMTG